VIHGCYQKSDGQLRVVAEGTSCRPSELAVSWNQQGPIGPSGPSGPPGAAGATGPAGPPGISGYTVVHVHTAANADDTKLIRAECPAGDSPLGGGAVLSGIADKNVALDTNGPTDTGWVAIAREVVATSGSWSLHVYAICAQVADSG
jgi:hypothetical protein